MLFNLVFLNIFKHLIYGLNIFKYFIYEIKYINLILYKIIGQTQNDGD